MAELERQVTNADGLDGLALRFGFWYGPGTAYASDGHWAEEVRRRRLPIVGGGAATWSFVHVDDVATATIAALEHGDPGVYNIADDDPAPAREWIPAYAEALGAEPPRRVPTLLVRMVAGRYAAFLATRDARRLEREGEARARLRAEMAELAPGVRGGARMSNGAREELLAELRKHALVIGEVTLSSGRKASYYVDAKRALLRPPAFLATGQLVAEQAGELGARAVGGLTMGADPIACAALAAAGAESDLVAFFVRKERKEHGLQRWVEGPLLEPGTPCLVVEDVVTTGGSTVKAIERIREEGLEIVGTVSILDRLAGGGEAIEAAGGGPYTRAHHDRRRLPGPTRVAAAVSRPGGCGSSARCARSSARRRRSRSARCAGR